jgi:CHAT domain-containing protein/Tfp pilus assembly protein PilF
MAPQRGPRIDRRIFAALITLVGFLAFSAAPLFGQATPWDQVQPRDPVTKQPLPNGNAPSTNNTMGIGSVPGPYTRPSPEQTQNFINNNPSFRNLDPGTRSAIINSGPGSGLLNSSYLPNGQPNPFYQNGQVTPNWYLPATWTSPYMNWQGVQSNGYLPSASPTTNGLNGYTPYNPTSYTPTYRPPPYQPQTLSRTAPNIPSQPTSSRPSMPSISVAANANGLLGPSSHDVMKAIESSTRSLALSESAGDKVAQVVNHADLAMLFVQRGDAENALMHISAAESMTKTVGDPHLQAKLLQTKGAAYMSTGEFEKAIDSLREAMQLFRSLKDDAGQADTFASSGWVFQSLGNVPRALGCYESAIYLYSKLGNKDGEVRTRLGIGSLYQSMGEHAKAAEEYKKAAPYASDEQYARMIVSVSEMLQAHNHPLEALPGYEKALALIKSTGNPALEGSILAGMGRAHMSSRSYEKAQSEFEQARAKIKESGNQAAEAGIVAAIGELHYWTAIGPSLYDPTRSFSKALRNYNEALPLMQAAGDRVGEIGVLTDTALVYDAWDKPRDALTFYRKALQRMDELETSARLEEFRLDLADQSASLYQRAILLEATLHHMEEAFDLSERARARTFLDQLGNHRPNLGREQPVDFSLREDKLRQENISLERQLGQELAKPGPEVNVERTRTIQARLSAVREEYEDLVNQLKLSNPEYSSFLSVSPLTLREAQQQLSADVTVLSYYTTPQMTLAFVLTRDDFHVSQLSVTQDELYMGVSTFRDFSGQSEDPATLKLLYKKLIAPLHSQLTTRKLAVVPYGLLNDLPFAALTPDGRRYLGDTYAITYLPSVSVLPYLHERTKPTGNQALVLANDKEPGLPRLSYAEGEARSVASLLGVQPLLGSDATASVLRNQAGNYDIVHLIAHFDLDSQHPLSSRILLGQGKGEEGSLELNDVFGLDFRNTNLVVLSGCQSQRGARTRGDDVIGLSRAFIYAGSSSVMASLWSVDDDATQQLMIAFYTHLKEGLSKAEALGAAQADVRHKYPNPFYWAGFVLTGAPERAAASSLRLSSAN